MPSSALYWHIGAMTTRLRSSRFLILKGSNNVDIMCSSFNVNFIVTETGPNIKDKGSVRNKKPLRYGGGENHLPFSLNEMTRSSIASLTCRNTSCTSWSGPVAFAGSSNPQC